MVPSNDVSHACVRVCTANIVSDAAHIASDLKEDLLFLKLIFPARDGARVEQSFQLCERLHCVIGILFLTLPSAHEVVQLPAHFIGAGQRAEDLHQDWLVFLR